MEELPKVNEFMDKTFITLRPDMDVYKAIDILLDKGVTSAVVTDDNNKIVGILSEKDVLILLTKDHYHQLPSGRVSDFMTKEVVTIPANTDIFTVAHMCFSHFFRRLVVADEEGRMVGQITRRDLLRVIKQFKKEEKRAPKKVAPIL
ncbi:MAG TPA: CBS domain-containing protein [Caldithrix abyssi]|uniref:CBS domain-containing protein n=1 Tax=Caldithrix abyssi TaxID=187145 RepID=A0A7V4WUB3_CALAY|nr:CBS domain-containing protein [Caldithrix abyssi]